MITHDIVISGTGNPIASSSSLARAQAYLDEIESDYPEGLEIIRADGNEDGEFGEDES